MRMKVLTTEGRVTIDVPDSWDRRIVSDHFRAIGDYLSPKRSVDRLQIFAGVKIEGWTLETDPDAIDEWWAQGHLDFLEIYEG